MNINPYWLSGFVDGEGTFYVGINRNSTMKFNFQVLPEFRVVQHEKDIKLLYALRTYFKAGVVRKNHDTRQELRIRSLKHINKLIIPHFDRYPLLSQKKFDYLKFKSIIKLINQKKHLSLDGIKQIITISAKMNRKNKIKALNILKK
jgi:hypothetical protein